ncbi:MAG: hypothetical protein CMD14_07380 [Flavobacteriales bacterium]|nr:hypothetical protein [Flavobacteriales bacterium]|tara:strand:- start:4070 stop:5407 length:1338 start_codon:yes stop_codon:yes gene_type:complete
MIKVISLSILFISSNLIFAQINAKKCITNRISLEAINNDTEYEEMRKNLINYHQENKNKNLKNQTEITIPVVIHIVHRAVHSNIGSGTNISNEQIEDQLRILNEDFSKTNSEFPNPPRNSFINYAANPGIKFCLASIDPNGNPTTGITRTATSRTSFDADDNIDADAMKKTSSGGINNWDPLRYLNIWVVNLSNSSGGGQTLGYAYLPGLQASNQSWRDGLVVDYQHFGSIDAANSSDGRTSTHEIGHYLGLSHTFCENGGGCCDNDNNSWFGLNVDDTPATDDVYFGSVNSSTNNNTCNDLNYGFSGDLLDMDENFMSYASNTWMFSNGQVDVMLIVLNATTNQGGRKNLWNNSNVTVNCVPTSTNDIITNHNVTIYPNPTQGDLFINSFEKVISITLCNPLGKVIKKTTNQEALSLKKLDNGVYIIHIKTEKGTITKKIILSK